MARKKRSRRSTGFWRSGGNRALAIVLFGWFVYAGLCSDWYTVIGLAVAIPIVETI